MCARNLSNILFLLILAIGFRPVIVQAQDTQKTENYLLIGLQSFSRDSLCVKSHVQNVRSVITYDKESGYYFYRFIKEWHTTDCYQLNIRSNIKTGYVYFFTVDATGGVSFLKVSRLDTLKEAPFAFSTCKDNGVLKIAGKEHLSVWFTSKEIKNYERLINAIELTYGDYIIRNKIQLGSSFQAVNNKWKFSKQQIGFYADPDLIKSNDEISIPLIVDFKIKD
jgi:uncharacterized protein YktA (UPF0223 family)